MDGDTSDGEPWTKDMSNGEPWAGTLGLDLESCCGANVSANLQASASPPKYRVNTNELAYLLPRYKFNSTERHFYFC